MNLGLGSHWVFQFERRPLFNRGGRQGASLGAKGAGTAKPRAGGRGDCFAILVPIDLFNIKEIFCINAEILDFGFCAALQCVVWYLFFFEYDHIDSTAGDFAQPCSVSSGICFFEYDHIDSTAWDWLTRFDWPLMTLVNMIYTDLLSTTIGDVLCFSLRLWAKPGYFDEYLSLIGSLLQTSSKKSSICIYVL